MKIRLMGLSMALILIVCVNAKMLVKLDKPAPGNQSTILFYRGSAFNQGGVGAKLAMDGTGIAVLKNNSYAEFDVPAGDHYFSVRGGGSAGRAGDLYSLPAGEKTCFRAKPRALNFIKALIPIWMIGGSAFSLDKVSCSDVGDLSTYTQLKVEYK